MVKVLVENHAEINARNNEGYTPLHLAAQNGHGDIVKFVIENGAIVNIEDVHGFTPLDRAIMFGKIFELFESSENALDDFKNKTGIPINCRR